MQVSARAKTVKKKKYSDDGPRDYTQRAFKTRMAMLQRELEITMAMRDQRLDEVHRFEAMMAAIIRDIQETRTAIRRGKSSRVPNIVPLKAKPRLPGCDANAVHSGNFSRAARD